jgi:hypothetical protein
VPAAAESAITVEYVLKKLVRAASLLLSLCLPVGAFGACGHVTGVDYCGPELISLLYVTASGYLYVQPTTPLSPTPQGFVCTPASGIYFVLAPSAPNFKQIYAALLSARVSGAPVTIVADPSQSTCTITYVTL